VFTRLRADPRDSQSRVRLEPRHAVADEARTLAAALGQEPTPAWKEFVREMSQTLRRPVGLADSLPGTHEDVARPGPTTGVRVLDEVRLTISCQQDIVTAHQRGRRMATDVGFAASDPTVIATAISELARNIIGYAARGEIILRLIEREAREGIEVVATDPGPGIKNVALAMQEGYSTSGGLGIGLPGVRHLMDEFEILSELGRGTRVTVRKWKRP
jgi:serine/threonine-protein kinase RsbT